MKESYKKVQKVLFKDFFHSPKVFFYFPFFLNNKKESKIPIKCFCIFPFFSNKTKKKESKIPEYFWRLKEKQGFVQSSKVFYFVV